MCAIAPRDRRDRRRRGLGELPVDREGPAPGLVGARAGPDVPAARHRLPRYSASVSPSSRGRSWYCQWWTSWSVRTRFHSISVMAPLCTRSPTVLSEPGRSLGPVLAVHAVWSPGRGVLLWAEDGDRPAASAARSLRSARPHPFAADPAALMALHPGKPATLTLLLPSAPGRPGRLARAGARPRRAARRAPPAGAAALDGARAGRRRRPSSPIPPRRPATAPRWRTCAPLAELADDLAARGRVLPTLVREAGAPHARWRPVVRGLDAVAVEALVEALPPVGRAEQAAPRDDARRRSAGARGRCARRAHRRRGARSAGPHGRHDARRRVGRAAAPRSRRGCARSPRPTPRVEAGERELAELADALREWDAVGAGPPGAGRASFRLSEVRTLHDPADPGDDPDDQTGDGTHWILEFFLQSTADPSLLVPAAQVWDGRAAPPPRRSAGAAARRAGARRPRDARPRARPARGPPGVARPGERRRPPVPHRRRAAARRRRVRGAAAPRVGRLAPRRAHALGPQHPGRSACSPAAASAARSWPISAGRWPSATRSSARRSWPSSWRPRRSSCGCAAGG